jgi:hypothetical protein
MVVFSCEKKIQISTLLAAATCESKTPSPAAVRTPWSPDSRLLLVIPLERASSLEIVASAGSSLRGEGVRLGGEIRVVELPAAGAGMIPA